MAGVSINETGNFFTFETDVLETNQFFISFLTCVCIVCFSEKLQKQEKKFITIIRYEKSKPIRSKTIFSNITSTCLETVPVFILLQ